MLTLLTQSPLLFLLLALILVISLSIHEFSHAFVADKLGDPTARYLGRVTLNPLAHLDPVGTLLLLFVGFGWGKPVPFNPFNLRNPKRDAALISFAGPAANFILAILFALVAKAFVTIPLVFTLASLVVLYNLYLGFFNLIPVHPLDGFKVVNGFLPPNLSLQWMQMESYGMIILLVMIVTRSTGLLIQPVVDFSLKLLGL